MSDSMTPPPELVEQWEAETAHTTKDEIWHVAVQAARWGADQELEACCEYVYERLKLTTVACIAQELRADRRPQPATLKQQALEAARIELNPEGKNGSLIIRALEALPDD